MGSASLLYFQILFSAFWKGATGIYVEVINKDDIKLTPLAPGNLYVLNSNDFPVTITCKEESPVSWDFEGNFTRIVNINGKASALNEVQLEYTSILNLLEDEERFVRPFSCRNLVTQKNSVVHIRLTPKHPDATYFLQPGSSHTVIPIVGEYEIFLPVKLLSPTQEIVIDKVSRVATRRVEIEYDPIRNGFFIDTPDGTRDEVDRCVGKYIFSQIGSGAINSVTVTVLKGVDFIYTPKEVTIMVSDGDTIRLECGSRYPVKIIRDGNNKLYNTTYSFNPKTVIRHKATLVYQVEDSQDSGTFTCTLSTGTVLRSWSYKVDATVPVPKISISRDGMELICSVSNHKKPVAIRMSGILCPNWESCKNTQFNRTKAQKETDRNVFWTENSCGYNCQSVKFNYAGGYIVQCSADINERFGNALTNIFVDLNRKIYYQSETINPRDITNVEVSDSTEDDNILLVKCNWISFHFADNVSLEINSTPLTQTLDLERRTNNGVSSIQTFLRKDSIRLDSTVICTFYPWNFDLLGGRLTQTCQIEEPLWQFSQLCSQNEEVLESSNDSGCEKEEPIPIPACELSPLFLVQEERFKKYFSTFLMYLRMILVITGTGLLVQVSYLADRYFRNSKDSTMASLDSSTQTEEFTCASSNPRTQTETVLKKIFSTKQTKTVNEGTLS